MRAGNFYLIDDEIRLSKEKEKKKSFFVNENNNKGIDFETRLEYVSLISTDQFLNV